LLKSFSWQELRHHPWRNAAAVMAVMLGVALAFSVHLINASALDEFSNAVRSVNGQPDLELRSSQGNFDEALFATVAAQTQVAHASPVLEISTYAIVGAPLDATNPKDRKNAWRIVGVDALVIARVAPLLMPVPATGADRFALFAPDAVFLNAAAQTLGQPKIQVQSGLQLRTLNVAGRINASGPPLGVMDIGAAQDLFGLQGQLSRIDIQLKPGVDRSAFIASLQSLHSWPAGVTVAAPEDAGARISNLSRAYRVNLTVLALVALFTGAFLVFSVLSLSVAKRSQQFALLGVLGLTGRERLALVLLESGALGLLGSVAGIALGTVLAATALKVLGGDLGGGYFSGVAPPLMWSTPAALIYGGLGLLAALVGGWWPARQAQALPPAQTLKGLGQARQSSRSHWISLILIALSALFAGTPAVFDIPLGAYVSVGLLLIGGITALPWLIALLLDRVSPLAANSLLPLLAVERARRVRESASVAVSGVVASLSLAVALTVMVASFRDSVTHWLDVVLPAELYVRTATSTSAGDTVYFSPEFVAQARQLPGVARLGTQRVRLLQLDPARPAVALIARPLDDPAGSLPLVGDPLPVPPGQVGIYVSEAMVDLYGARPGARLSELPFFSAFGDIFKSKDPQVPADIDKLATFFIAGVWRDYARQGGAVAIGQRDFERLTGDRRVNDLALWLEPSVKTDEVQKAIRDLADHESAGAGSLIEFASSREIRAISLKIFDRSFAVTYWLQAVAIAIGLFGVAASFSAQVLSRRKEFGLLVHLGLTRRQVLGVVAGEGLAWTAVGSVAGLGLGLAVSLVLVKVVNPQSFHWTMDMAVPWLRLTGLCLAVVLAGTVTAWLAGRAAAGRDAVLAVKEDW
jgi:putative ABC transport system permease protein